MNKTIKGLQKKIKQYKKYIVLSKKEMAHINDILGMTTEEICQKYGYKRDDAIFHSTIFPNGIEARIYLRIINEKGWIPITDITLFKDGKELVHETEVDARYEGEWRIEYEGIEYIVNIIAEEIKKFLDIKIGDVVIVCDEYSRDYSEHIIKVDSIEYDKEYITETNPDGMICYGTDLEEEEWGDDYVTVVTEVNFMRIQETTK